MDKRHLLSDQDIVLSEPTECSGTNFEAGFATAPPAEQGHTLAGYDGDGAVVGGSGHPPPYNRPPLLEPPNESLNRHWMIPAISEELAREVFTEYASNKCCYSGKPAKEMIFSNLYSLDTYRYQLETFTESRSTGWASEPYKGQVVDGCSSVAPGPWDLPIPVPALFKDCETEVRIPHTSSLRGCQPCLNLGRSACNKCVTSGMAQCRMCNGRGRDLNDRRCSHCGGQGRVRCDSCSGVGSTPCMTCDGKGQLLCFMKLTVKWKNNSHVTVVDKRSGFPLDLLDRVTGEMLFTDMNQQVHPVVNFPDNSVNAASETIVREHQAQFSTSSRILQQRQTIELIPITRVHYSWKEKTHIFFVYGAEHQVFTKDYPAKCCCCSIM